MGRLIDADVVWRKLQYRLKAYGNGHMCKKYKEMLDSIPTAYDVEQVVEELKSLSNAEADYYYAKSNDVIDRETAIDIVKRGGVE